MFVKNNLIVRKKIVESPRFVTNKAHLAGLVVQDSKAFGGALLTKSGRFFYQNGTRIWPKRDAFLTKTGRFFNVPCRARRPRSEGIRRGPSGREQREAARTSQRPGMRNVLVS